MTRLLSRRLLAALPLGALLLAAGCSHPQDTGGGPGGPGGGPGGMRGGPGGAVAATASGADIYQQKCAGCHGAQGQGARGPSLARAASRPEADVVGTIHDGHGRMPAFANQLSSDQITKVADYVRQLKPGAG